MKRSKMHSFVVVLKISTPPISYPRVIGLIFSPLLFNKGNSTNPIINTTSELDSHPVTLKYDVGGGTCFQNYNKRVHF